MEKTDWSVEQLERELAASFASLGRMERGGVLAAGESAALAEGVLRCMNGALVRVSETLEAQTVLRNELDALRGELARSQDAQAAQARAQGERIRALEAEVEELRRDRGSLAESIETLRQGSLFDYGRPHAPSDQHLSRPLVARSAQGDFLGVTDPNGQALSLGDFLRLVEFCGDPERIVCSLWERRDDAWFLTLGLSGRPGALKGCYVLETRAVLTPSGNRVTELVGVSEEGVRVPNDYVLKMFRQLREGL